MNPIIFDFPDPTSLGSQLRDKLNGEEGKFLIHPFPDGETYLRVLTPVQGRDVIVNATLFHPNEWLLNLLFLANALKAQHARQITLVAPYLSYMRQDKQFQPGQGITSKYFAKLISNYFDSLITIDPHLHRWHLLNDIYSIPTKILHATDNIFVGIE